MRKKRIIPILALLMAGILTAAPAEPMKMAADLEETVRIELNDRADYVYTYRYPQADPEDPAAEAVNAFYQYRADDAKGFEIPMNADYYRTTDPAEDVVVSIDYEITCNNDDFLSVLVRSRQGELINYMGHTFSRKGLKEGNTVALPYLLGLLENDETDQWLQDRQKEKADRLLREMVWERLPEATGGLVPEDLDEETFGYAFFPEEDFYLDGTGNPVFYLQPGVAEDSDRLVTIPISIEEIMDEM